MKTKQTIMKTTIKTLCKFSLLALLLGTLFTSQTSAQTLYVTQFTDIGPTGTVSTYDAITGAVINPLLVTGLSEPFGLAVAGGNLWVQSDATQTVGEYNATTGAAINASLIPNGLAGVAIDGNNLYIVNRTNGVAE